MDRLRSSFWPKAAMAIDTSCRLSVRFCAVTTTSSRVAWASTEPTNANIDAAPSSTETGFFMSEIPFA